MGRRDLRKDRQSPRPRAAYRTPRQMPGPSSSGLRVCRSIEQKTRATSRPCAQTYPRPCGRRLSRTQRAAVGKQPSPTASGCLSSIPVHRTAGRSGRDPGLVSLLDFRSSRCSNFEAADKRLLDYVSTSCGATSASRDNTPEDWGEQSGEVNYRQPSTRRERQQKLIS